MPEEGKQQLVGGSKRTSLSDAGLANSDDGGATSEDESGDDRFDWDQYLSETKAIAAPHDCFWQARHPPENRFQVGQKLEAVDPRNNAITSVATVFAVCGPKIKLRLDGTASSNDFWVHIDSSRIFPFGYTEEHGSYLQPPLCYQKDPVRYQSLIMAAKESGNLAPRSCFLEEPPRPTSNHFKVGMKFEAVDTRNPTWICPATVISRDREKIRIEYDGWNQTDLVRFDSRDLYPCGWWKQAGIDLSKPPTFKKKLPVRRVRCPSSDSASRPSSSASSHAHQIQDFQNIFDTVLGNATLSQAPVATGPHSGTTLATAGRSTTPHAISSSVAAPTVSTQSVIPKHAARKSVYPFILLDDQIPTEAPPAVNARKSAAPPGLQGNGRAVSPVIPPVKARKSTSAPGNDKRPMTPLAEEPPAVKARKSIAYTQLSSDGQRENTSNKTRLNNGLATKSIAYNMALIPQPDVVISVDHRRQPPQPETVTFFFNTACNCGPYLESSQLERRFHLLAADLPLHLAMREAFQLLIDSARSGLVSQVLEAVPSADMKAMKALSIVATGPDRGTVTRFVPMYSTMAAVKQALSESLIKLKACQNLLAITKTECALCDNQPAAKKARLVQQCQVDTVQEDTPAGDVTESTSAAVEAGSQWFCQDATKWSVDDVVCFIGTVVDAYSAQLFKRQEIDGRALVLLTPEILIKYMDVRVGPAIKISNAIERLKGTNRPSYINSAGITAHQNTGSGKNV